MTQQVVSLSGISKQYSKFTVLEDVTLELNAGEVLGLFGHNGAGKTTMMKMILGVLAPSGGALKVFGEDIGSHQAAANRDKIGYLPENVSFYEHLTGAQVIRYFARLKSVPKAQALDLLDQVGLAEAINRPVKTYSKGMRQRLGLAQAFLGDPKLLLLDEPTSGLDPIATYDFYQSVAKLKSNGSSVILCSHGLTGVEHYIDRAMILSHGKTLAIGTVEELRASAGLPVHIDIVGGETEIASSALLSAFSITKNRLEVPESKKVQVFKELMNIDSIVDVHFKSADLNDLYQYYIAKTNQIPLQTASSNRAEVAL